METTKITKRNYFEAIIAKTEAGTLDFSDVNPDITVDMIKEFAVNEIAILDKKAEKAKAYASKKAAATDALTEIIKNCLVDTYATINEITAKVVGIDAEATTNKVSYRLGKLVEAGVASKKEITVSGSEGKARKLQAYALVVDAE